MKKLTIAHRLILMIVVSALSLLLVGGVGLYVAQKGEEDLKHLTGNGLASVQILAEARQAFMRMRIDVYAHVLNSDPATMQGLEALLNKDADEAMARFKHYADKLLSNDDDKKMIETNIANLKTYVDFVTTDVLPKSRKGDQAAALLAIRTKGKEISDKSMQNLNDHALFNDRLAADITKVSLHRANEGRYISLAVILAGVLAIGLLGYSLFANIRASLKQIQAIVDQVESGLDFTVRGAKKSDEIGQTTSAFNRLLDKLQGNLKSIATSVQSVASAASEMSCTSSQVATASTQQSEASSDMAATVEQMTVSINHIAERAQEASRLSSESGQIASTGEVIIGQTVSDIQSIALTVNAAAEIINGLEQHSQQISNVVAVIKEVADQTNLLALNAAIEAARAGEQGRGFAVVADEVRKLAERTSSSTQEISNTINTMRTSAGDAVSSMQDVVDKVAHGVERAQQANDSIKKIGEGSRNAVTMVEEIATAIREQGTATNNIAIQVERIAQMSEESSSSAANSAKAAQQLDLLAKDMRKIVNAYRL